MRRYLDGRAMDDVAIERIRCFEKEAFAKHPDGYYLAFSGGKDSVVILDLAKRAGVKFTAHHHLTTVDPPELVRFVQTFPEVKIERPPKTMWQIIRQEGIPPLRHKRYCCRMLKERGGKGRIVIMGIRSAESHARACRGLMEVCRHDLTKHFLNPILDWPTEAVWEYIRERGLRYCRLYDEGFDRLGCVLCPNVRPPMLQEHLRRWPAIALAWRSAIEAIGDDFDRWLDRDAPFHNVKDGALFDDTIDGHAP